MLQCRGIEGKEVGVGGWRNTLTEAREGGCNRVFPGGREIRKGNNI
jgi:hypothetical protein